MENGVITDVQEIHNRLIDNSAFIDNMSVLSGYLNEEIFAQFKSLKNNNSEISSERLNKIMALANMLTDNLYGLKNAHEDLLKKTTIIDNSEITMPVLTLI